MKIDLLDRKTNIILFSFSAVAIFFIVYLPALNIPFHSDDYSYFLQGISWEVRLKHYMNWSGRLITDFTSSSLLNLFSKPIYTAINSLVMVVIVINITILPYIIMKKDIFSHRIFISLWMIFFAYWLSNPNLGQTTYWIVGSANYIWPLMWASIYFVLLFHLLSNEKKLNILNVFSLILFGILASFSNEATGVSVLFLTFLLLFLYKEQKKTIIFALFITLIGFLFLYLAPGNYARLAHPAFASWGEMSLIEKIARHLFYRMPSKIVRYSFMIGVLIITIYFLNKHRTNKRVSNNSFMFIYAFIAMSIFSLLVFVKSPAMPPRSLNTGLFFLLYSYSFVLVNIHFISQNTKSIFISRFTIFISTIFAISYALFSYAITQTKYQEQVRDSVIEEAKNSGINEAKIPDWHFTKLLKNSDRFDMYRSGAMPKYYGIEKITWLPANFNYGILRYTKPNILNFDINSELKLLSIYSYRELFLMKKAVLVFDSQLKDNITVNFYKTNKLSKTTKIISDNFTLISGKYYYPIPFKFFDIKEFDKIGFILLEKEEFLEFKINNIGI